MMRKSFALVLISLFVGLSSANAQTEQQAADQPKPTNYEKFITRTDKLIVTKSYPIGKLPGGSGGYDVSAQVAWTLGETEKVYAARVGWRVVDFEQLQPMQDGLDKMLQAVNGHFDQLDATSMQYSSPAGWSVSYYVYNDSSGKPRRNLYLAIGGYVSQSPTTERLVEVRNLLAQARAKLVSLGAR